MEFNHQFNEESREIRKDSEEKIEASSKNSETCFNELYKIIKTDLLSSNLSENLSFQSSPLKPNNLVEINPIVEEKCETRKVSYETETSHRILSNNQDNPELSNRINYLESKVQELWSENKALLQAKKDLENQIGNLPTDKKLQIFPDNIIIQESIITEFETKINKLSEENRNLLESVKIIKSNESIRRNQLQQSLETEIKKLQIEKKFQVVLTEIWSTENSKLNEQYNELQSKLASEKEKNEKLQLKVTEEINFRANIVNQKLKLEEKCRELKTAKDNAEECLSKMRESEFNTKRDLERVNNELQSSDSKIKNLQDDNTKLQKQIDSLRSTSIEEHRNAGKPEDSELRDLKIEKRLLQEFLDSKSIALKKSQSLSFEKNREIQSLKEHIEVKTRQIIQLQRELQGEKIKFQDETRKLSSEIEELKEQVTRLKTEGKRIIESLKNDKYRFKVKIEELTTALNKKESEDEFRQHKIQLEAEINKLTTENAKICQLNHEITEKESFWKLKYDKLNKEFQFVLDRTDFKVVSLEDEKTKLKNEIKSMQAGIISDTQLKEDMAKQIERLEMELDTLKKELDHVKNEVHEHQRLIQHKNQAITDYENKIWAKNEKIKSLEEYFETNCHEIAQLKDANNTIRGMMLELRENLDSNQKYNDVFDLSYLFEESNEHSKIIQHDSVMEVPFFVLTQFIHEIKHFIYKLMDDEMRCSICTETLTQAVILECSHLYCEECLNSWKRTKNECPLCRARITSQIRSTGIDNIVHTVMACYYKLLQFTKNESKFSSYGITYI